MPHVRRGTVVLLFQPAEERNSVRNPMGGAIRMIRDWAASEELCRELGVKVVTRPKVDTTVVDDKNIKDGRDDTFDEALLGRTRIETEQNLETVRCDS